MHRFRTIALIIGIGFGAVIGGSLPAGAESTCTGLLCPPPPPLPGSPSEEPSRPPAESEPEPAPQPQPQPKSQPQPAASPGTVDHAGAARLLDLVNEERRRVGAPPLGRRSDVDGDALGHSRDMAREGTLRHNDAWFSAATRQRLGARRLGENVAMNTAVEDAHRRLMASEGHRRNILDPQFRLVGLAVVRGESSWFITQSFIEPVAASSAPANARPAPPGPAAPQVRAARSQAPGSAPAPAPAPATTSASMPTVAEVRESVPAPPTTTTTETARATAPTKQLRTAGAASLPALPVTGEVEEKGTVVALAVVAIAAFLLRLLRITPTLRLRMVEN